MRKRKNKKCEGVQRVGRHTAPFFIALCAAMNVCSFHASAEETSAAAEQSIWVARYTFSGENPVTEAELADVLAAHRHTEATLTQLEAQAEEVTKYLRSKGYFVAFAYLAPQDFKDGVVDFTIVPGRYDNIVVNNTSYLHETAIRREIGIDSGELVKKSTLNRGVWLTNDLSRVETNTQIKAGSRQGTTDLVVNVKNKGHRTWGYVGVDNGGYRHTGRYQYSAFVNYASPFREGDLLSVGGVVSNGGMWSGSASYMTPSLSTKNSVSAT